MAVLKNNKPVFLLLAWFLVSFLFGWISVGPVKSLQALLFSFPFAVVLVLPLGRNLRHILLPIALAAFVITDFYFGVQGYLKFEYQASLYSGFILESTANTSFSESKEYLLAMAPQIAVWAGAVIIVFFIQAFLSLKLLGQKPLTSKKYYWFAALIIGLSLFGWYQKAWRAHYPAVRLITFYQECESKKEYWKNIEKENLEALKKARSEIVSVEKVPRTIVLVIGESMNRNNMSLYGYQRNTTPKLSENEQTDSDFYTGKEAFSTKSSTVAAFNDMFNFPGIDTRPDSKLFAFFRAAGYKITWISNQDDIAIKAEFQNFSNQAVNLNRISGRSSTSMDERVLPELEKALASPDDKKLIVVHLIGIHPHFSFRYPSGLNSLWNEEDGVRKKLENLGRSSRTLELLENYDKAMLYQDGILDKTLELTQDFDKKHPNVKTSWIFLSDHSVETGQMKDRTGHSNSSLAGYTIPFLFWTPDNDLSEGEVAREDAGFRADWLSYMLLDLAGIHVKFPIYEKSWLSPSYHWIEPKVVTDLKQQDKDR